MTRARLCNTVVTSCKPTVRLLREELQLLQEPGSYVGEVIKVIRCTELPHDSFRLDQCSSLDLI